MSSSGRSRCWDESGPEGNFRRDGAALLLATIAVLGVLFDRRLGRIEAVLLLVGLPAYLVVLLRRSSRTTPTAGGGTVESGPTGNPLLVALARWAVDLLGGP